MSKKYTLKEILSQIFRDSKIYSKQYFLSYRFAISLILTFLFYFTKGILRR